MLGILTSTLPLGYFNFFPFISFDNDIRYFNPSCLEFVIMHI